MLNGIAQDLRFALRQLRRSPGFAFVAILTAALGIGANTAIFTLAHAILLRQLPVEHPSSLYRIGDGEDCCINGGMPDDQKYSLFSTEMYRKIRDNVPEFESVAATPAGEFGTGLARRAGTNDAVQRMRGSFVSGNYFQTFGLKPHMGRLLTPADDAKGQPAVAVMSYATWANQYNGDPTIVGASFLLDNHPTTVVGIAPPGFYGDRVRSFPPDFYMPIADEALMSDTPFLDKPGQDLQWLYLIGRLRPGADPAVVQQKVAAVLRGHLATQRSYASEEGKKELPKVHTVLVSAATGIMQEQQNRFRTGLLILLALSALVLLIACANIANLLLARAMTRRSEISVRVALGAPRASIFRQGLVESILLALLGGVFGTVLAWAGARAMLSLAFTRSSNLPIGAAPSAPVLLFTLVVSILTAIVFGVFPAWGTTRNDPAEALRGANRVTRDSSVLPQRTLVILQAALSLVLITVAALLTRSLNRLQFQDFGFTTQNRIVVHLEALGSGYKSQALPALTEHLRQRLSTLPGATDVAFANYSPLEGNNWGESIYVEGKPDPAFKQDIYSSWDRVSPGFFKTVGQTILRGRDFATSDTATAPQVSLINEAFAKKFFPGEDPIGRRFGTERGKFTYTVIGVVRNAKYSQIDGVPQPMCFRSILQPDPNADPADMAEILSSSPNTILIAFSSPAAANGEVVRRAIGEIEPGLAITRIQSLDAQIAGLLDDQRMVARLTAAFGILALVLASIGLYGVTAYAVAQRIPEIGLRMALGADRSSVLGLVLRGALVQSLIGLVLGIPLALLAGHYLQSQLYGIKGNDLPSILGAAAILALSAFLAGLLPARRASGIEPMRALRSE